MKTIIALICFAIAHPAFAGIIREPILASIEMLNARGVQISKIMNRGVFVSADIHASVSGKAGEESFEAMEFVVYDEEISDEGLGRRDSYRSQDATRRERTKNREGKFTVIGKDIQRAYLVFEFLGPSSSPMSHYRRYIIPVKAVDEEEANKAAQTTPGSSAAPRV